MVRGLGEIRLKKIGQHIPKQSSALFTNVVQKTIFVHIPACCYHLGKAAVKFRT